MGTGNSNISDDTINQYYQANKNDPYKILGAVLANNVSIEQYARATGLPINDVKNALQNSAGINLNPIAQPQPQTQQQITVPKLPDNATVQYQNVNANTVQPIAPVSTTPVQYKSIDAPPVVNTSNADVSRAVINPTTDTVAGQANKILNNPNSPLMVNANTQGLQYANSRGLLNTSMGSTAATQAMINSALQIATPDAANSNQINMFNTNNANDISKFNANNANQIGMFNASNVVDVNKTNAANALQAGMFNANAANNMGQFNANLLNSNNQFNAGILNDTNRFNASNALSASVANAGNIKDYAQLQTQMDIANLDSGTKLKIANIDALSKDSSLAAGLNQQLMSAIVDINKQDKPLSVRQAEIEQMVNLTTQSIGLLQSFDSKVPALNFNDIISPQNKTIATSGASSANSSDNGTTNKVSADGTRSDGASSVPGVDGKIGSYGSIVPNDNSTGYQLYTRNALQPITLDTNDYKLSTPELSNVKGYIKGLGVNVDISDVAPQELINEINRMQGNQTGEASSLFFTPVYAPGAIDPSFYIYKAALPKYQK